MRRSAARRSASSSEERSLREGANAPARRSALRQGANREAARSAKERSVTERPPGQSKSRMRLMPQSVHAASTMRRTILKRDVSLPSLNKDF